MDSDQLIHLSVEEDLHAGVFGSSTATAECGSGSMGDFIGNQMEMRRRRTSERLR